MKDHCPGVEDEGFIICQKRRMFGEDLWRAFAADKFYASSIRRVRLRASILQVVSPFRQTLQEAPKKEATFSLYHATLNENG